MSLKFGREEKFLIMTDNDLDMCILIRESLFPDGAAKVESAEAGSTSVGQAREGIRECDWQSLFQEMQAQAITALPYHFLQAHPLSDQALYKQWMVVCERRKARWLQIMFAQSELIRLLEKHGIPSVILKGMSAAMAYPDPMLRTCGDIDIMVKRKDFQEASKLLQENGYELESHNDAMHHYGFKKDGISFELHKRLAIVQERDEALLSLFEDGIDRKQKQSIEGFSFYSLPMDLNGLVLLFHINQHLRSGLGLRQIIDWMMYVDRNRNLEQLMPLLEQTGQKKLALTVTLMCQKYLGLSKAWADSIQDSYWIESDLPCDELMDYILEKGNFGKKSGVEGKTASVFLIESNPLRFFKRLQVGGKARWKAAKKHKMLRPFAWIYGAGFAARQLISHRVSPAKLRRAHYKGLNQRELIQRLGLSIDRKIRI